MALTFTSLAKVNMGSVNAVMYNVSSDGTSGAVLTSLGYIFGGTITPVSAASTGSVPAFKVNTTAGSAVCNGAFFISGGVAGDVYTVVVYGKS